MSATSFKPMPTLQGLFTEPKMNHRRNFLLENKLSLREKTNKVLNRQQIEQQKLEKEQNEKMQHQRIQQLYEKKRSTSLAKTNVCNATNQNINSKERSDSLSRHFTTLSLKSNKSNQGGSYLECKPSHQNLISSQRSRRSVHEQGTNLPTAIARPPSQISKINHDPSLKSLGSNIVGPTVSSNSVSKNIQTEDITDEDFLLNALQKCKDDYMQRNDSDIDRQSQKPVQNQQSYHQAVDNQPNEQPLNGGTNDDVNILYTNNRMCHNDDIDKQSLISHQVNCDGDNHSIFSHRSHTSQMIDPNTVPLQSNRSHMSHLNDPNSEPLPNNRSNNPILLKSNRSHMSHTNDPNNVFLPSNRSHNPHEDTNAVLPSNRSNNPQPNVTDVFIGDNINNENGLPNVEQPLSGRSRISLASNKSRRQPHQLGSRENIRLPAYMERENREKAAEALKAAQYDPDCPPGYYLLSEEERKEAIEAIGKRFDTLVCELNRLPVTMDTMRVRNRRMAIEKELALLEADSMSLAKQKVYVKRDNDAAGDN